MRIYKLFTALLLPVFSHCTYTAFGQELNPHSFEQKVQQVVRQVSAACVRISKSDSTGHRRFGSFSGVVISADGLILSAAHATITGESYLVEFPDGKKYKGIALGRITAVDAAMIQIDTVNSVFPYCEMGWSYDLKVNQPCLSIAYPASLNELKKPVVRLGYIARTVTPEGKMQTTCLMEPGDSGGPVFDLYGRVIALHAKIESALSINLENPIDNYRKYWGALKKKIEYADDAYPDAEEAGTDPLEKKLVQVETPIPLSGIIKSVKNKYQSTTISIKSNYGSVAMKAWGSIVSLNDNSKADNVKSDYKNAGYNKTDHNKTDRKKAVYVLSKSSMVGDHPVFITYDLKTLPARVVKRDPENDLVLLTADGLANGIAIDKAKPDILYNRVGSFMISPSFSDSVRVGVLGNDSVAVKIITKPVLGIICVEPDSHTVKIIGFSVSIVQNYGLAVDDTIDSLNGLPVTSAKQLSLYVSGMNAGDEAIYVVTRANKKLRIHSVFQKLPKAVNRHVADTFDGGMSLRNEGFNWVFVHDSMVRPEECGGPVFDLDGNFCGINIARISRTSTLSLPASVLMQFVLSYTPKPLSVFKRRI